MWPIACLRIEVQLLHKARGNRPKDQIDLRASLPHLSADAKAWLRQALDAEHPVGHPWIAALTDS